LAHWIHYFPCDWSERFITLSHLGPKICFLKQIINITKALTQSSKQDHHEKKYGASESMGFIQGEIQKIGIIMQKS